MPPGAEADGQQNAQGGDLVGLAAGQADQAGADQAYQAHIQECAGEAIGEIVGGNFAGIPHNVPQILEHILAVGHNERRNNKAQGDKQEKVLQKALLGKVLDFLHNNTSMKIWAIRALVESNCPDSRLSSPILPCGTPQILSVIWDAIF